MTIKRYAFQPNISFCRTRTIAKSSEEESFVSPFLNETLNLHHCVLEGRVCIVYVHTHTRYILYFESRTDRDLLCMLDTTAEQTEPVEHNEPTESRRSRIRVCRYIDFGFAPHLTTTTTYIAVCRHIARLPFRVKMWWRPKPIYCAHPHSAPRPPYTSRELAPNSIPLNCVLPAIADSTNNQFAAAFLMRSKKARLFSTNILKTKNHLRYSNGKRRRRRMLYYIVPTSARLSHSGRCS